MAWSYESVTTSTRSATTAFSITLPANRVRGDVLLVVIRCKDSLAFTPTSNGWRSAYPGYGPGGPGDQVPSAPSNFHIFWRRIDGTVSNTQTFTAASSTSGLMQCFLVSGLNGKTGVIRSKTLAASSATTAALTAESGVWKTDNNNALLFVAMSATAASTVTDVNTAISFSGSGYTFTNKSVMTDATLALTLGVATANDAIASDISTITGTWKSSDSTSSNSSLRIIGLYLDSNLLTSHSAGYIRTSSTGVSWYTDIAVSSARIVDPVTASDRFKFSTATWVVKVGSWVARELSNNPSFRIGMYTTAANPSNQPPAIYVSGNTYLAETANISVSTSDENGGANVERAFTSVYSMNDVIPLVANQAVRLGFLSISNKLTVAGRIQNSGQTVYTWSGVTAFPTTSSAIIDGASSSNSLVLDIYAVGEQNFKPIAPTQTTPTGTIYTGYPTFAGNFRDYNGLYGESTGLGVDRGDRLSCSLIELSQNSVVIWRKAGFSTQEERDADLMSVAYNEVTSLSNGSYSWRATTGDSFSRLAAGIADSGTTTTLTDAANTFTGLSGHYLVITSGTNQFQWRPITSVTTNTVTVSPAFATAITNGIGYEIREVGTWSPSIVFTVAAAGTITITSPQPYTIPGTQTSLSPTLTVNWSHPGSVSTSSLNLILSSSGGTQSNQVSSVIASGSTTSIPLTFFTFTEATSYTLTVEALDQAGVLSNLAQTTFKTNSRPAAPTGLVPSEYTVLTSLANLTVSAASDADNATNTLQMFFTLYRPDASTVTSLRSYNNGWNWQLTATEVSMYGEYGITAQTFDGELYSTAVPGFFRYTAPGSVAIVSPPAFTGVGTSFSANSPFVFSWSSPATRSMASANIEIYAATLSEGSYVQGALLSQVVVSQTVLNGQTFGVGQSSYAFLMQNNTRYFLRVRGTDQDGVVGSWSETRLFKTNDPPGLPQNLEGISPADADNPELVFGNNGISAGRPLLRAQSIADSDDSELTGLQGLIDLQKIGSNASVYRAALPVNGYYAYQTTAEDLPEYGQYRWRMTAFDGTDYSGGTPDYTQAQWTNWQTFWYSTRGELLDVRPDNAPFPYVEISLTPFFSGNWQAAPTNARLTHATLIIGSVSTLINPLYEKTYVFTEPLVNGDVFNIYWDSQDTLLSQQTYYYQLYGMDELGTVTARTTIQSFQTYQAPALPLLIPISSVVTTAPLLSATMTQQDPDISYTGYVRIYQPSGASILRTATTIDGEFRYQMTEADLAGYGMYGWTYTAYDGVKYSGNVTNINNAAFTGLQLFRYSTNGSLALNGSLFPAALWEIERISSTPSLPLQWSSPATRRLTQLAIQLTATNHNVLANPNAGSLLTQWVTTPGNVTRSVDQLSTYVTEASLKIVTTGNASNQGITYSPTIAATSSEAWTFSAYLKGSGTWVLRLLEVDASDTVLATYTASVTPDNLEWTRYSVTATLQEAGTVKIVPQMVTTGAATVAVDGLMLERSDTLHGFNRFYPGSTFANVLRTYNAAFNVDPQVSNGAFTALWSNFTTTALSAGTIESVVLTGTDEDGLTATLNLGSLQVNLPPTLKSITSPVGVETDVNLPIQAVFSDPLDDGDRMEEVSYQIYEVGPRRYPLDVYADGKVALTENGYVAPSGLIYQSNTSNTLIYSFSGATTNLERTTLNRTLAKGPLTYGVTYQMHLSVRDRVGDWSVPQVSTFVWRPTGYDGNLHELLADLVLAEVVFTEMSANALIIDPIKVVRDVTATALMLESTADLGEIYPWAELEADGHIEDTQFFNGMGSIEADGLVQEFPDEGRLIRSIGDFEWDDLDGWFVSFGERADGEAFVGGSFVIGHTATIPADATVQGIGLAIDPAMTEDEGQTFTIAVDRWNGTAWTVERSIIVDFDILQTQSKTYGGLPNWIIIPMQELIVTSGTQLAVRILQTMIGPNFLITEGATGQGGVVGNVLNALFVTTAHPSALDGQPWLLPDWYDGEMVGTEVILTASTDVIQSIDISTNSRLDLAENANVHLIVDDLIRLNGELTANPASHVVHNIELLADNGMMINGVLSLTGVPVSRYTRATLNSAGIRDVLTVEEPEGWKSGDPIYIEETSLGSKGLRTTIASIDGDQLYLNEQIGMYVREGAHIVLMTRNMQVHADSNDGEFVMFRDAIINLSHCLLTGFVGDPAFMPPDETTVVIQDLVFESGITTSTVMHFNANHVVEDLLISSDPSQLVGTQEVSHIAIETVGSVFLDGEVILLATGSLVPGGDLNTSILAINPRLQDDYGIVTLQQGSTFNGSINSQMLPTGIRPVYCTTGVISSVVLTDSTLSVIDTVDMNGVITIADGSSLSSLVIERSISNYPWLALWGNGSLLKGTAEDSVNTAPGLIVSDDQESFINFLDISDTITGDLIVQSDGTAYTLLPMTDNSQIAGQGLAATRTAVITTDLSTFLPGGQALLIRATADYTNYEILSRPVTAGETVRYTVTISGSAVLWIQASTTNKTTDSIINTPETEFVTLTLQLEATQAGIARLMVSTTSFCRIDAVS